MLKVVLSCLLFAMAGIHASGNGNVREISVTLNNEKAVGVAHEVLYEEEVKDVVVSDEDGFIQVTENMEDMCLRQKTSIQGAYYTEECLPIRDLYEIALDPIETVLLPKYDDEERESEFTLLNGEEKIVVKGKGKVAIGKYVEAGEIYRIKEKDPEDFRPIDMEIAISRYKPLRAEEIELSHQRRGRLVFKGPEGAVIGLYEDMEGKKKLMREGKHVSSKAGETIYLDDGMYGADIEYPALYYEDDEMLQVVMDRSQEETVIIEGRPVQPKIHVTVPGKNNCQIFLMDGKQEIATYENDGKEHVIPVERAKTYQIYAKARPGFYDAEPVECKVNAQGPDPHVELSVRPFAVSVKITEDGLGHVGHILVRDEKGYILQKVPCGENGVEISGLEQGHTYVLSVMASQMHTSSEALTMTIAGESHYDVNLPVISYADLTFEQENGSLYALYSNRQCTDIARDVSGHVLQRFTGGMHRLRAGTYYLKQMEKGEKQYPWIGVKEIVLKRGGMKTILPYEPCKVSLQAVSTDGETLDMELVLRSGGMIVERFRKLKECVLEPGRKYVLEQAQDMKGYIHANPVSFTVPLHKKENKYALHTEAYRTLMVDAPVEAKLYKDEKGLLEAGDIYGREVVFGNGHKAYDLRAGVYYLKYTGMPNGYYVPTRMNKIELFQNYVPYIETFRPVRLQVAFKDEQNKFASGAVFALYDESGKEMERWVTDADVHETSCLLNAGKAYTLKQLEVPSGHKRMETDIVYTMPNEEPQETPLLTVRTDMYDTHVKLEKKKEGSSEKRQERFEAWILPVGVLMVFAVVTIMVKKR